jgi:hypothetical protein
MSIIGSIVKAPFRLVKKGIDSAKGATPENGRTRQLFVMDMADLLVSYGMPIEDAIRTSADFYSRNRSIMKDVGIFY